VHTWTFVLWGARLTFCGVSDAYSCLYCCLSGGYFLSLDFSTVAILYVALPVNAGRRGGDGVVDAGGEAWCWQAV